MAELSKSTGDHGEANAKIFLDFLGWTPRIAKNTDFECALTSHKSKGGNDKSSHGIDFTYSYLCPYTKTEKIIIIDSKAIKWEQTKGSRKPVSTISKEISSYVSELHKTLNCTSLSADFKEKFRINRFCFRRNNFLFCS